MTQKRLYENPDGSGNLSWCDGGVTFMIFPSGFMYVDPIMYSDHSKTHYGFFQQFWESKDEASFLKRCKSNDIHFVGNYKACKKYIPQDGDEDIGYRKGRIDGRIWPTEGKVSVWNHLPEFYPHAIKTFKIVSEIPEVKDIQKFEFTHDDVEFESFEINGLDRHDTITVHDVLKHVKSLSALVKRAKAERSSESMERYKLLRQYHTETDPVAKRALAAKLGMIKPQPLKFGMPQWKADQVRGVAEGVLNENPDTTHDGCYYYDADACPFLIYPSMYMWGSNVTYPYFSVNKCSGLVHPEISATISNSSGDASVFERLCKQKKIGWVGNLQKTYDHMYNPKVPKSHLIKGRVWTDRNTISFWDKDVEVIKHIKKIFFILKKHMGIENPESLMWDIYNDTLDVNGKQIPRGEATLMDALRVAKGSGDNKETDEQTKKRELMMAYHTETDPQKKRQLAVQLGLIQPKPLKFGVPQWKADQVRGVAESKFKNMINEMYGIEDDTESLSERLIKECISDETPTVDTDFKTYMTERNLV